jgi:transcriptional regulator with PAS, ATPase and Fis domain
VAQSCAAIPESLLESELFGYEKGAFTDAHCSREGLFAAARNGTLFLDEIAEMSLEAQAKLLRVLETGEVRRLGDIQTHKIDVRVLAATSCDLQAAMEGGHFRPELYYRLNVLSVHLPPLRQRRQDIPLLAGHFLSAYAAKTGKSLSGFSPEVLTALRRYCWPGNVRQLRNEVERMAALAEEGAQISAGLLSGQVLEPGPRTRQDGDSLPEALRRLRESMIREALEKCGGNRTHAAALLGISRANLQRTMRRLGID